MEGIVIDVRGTRSISEEKCCHKPIAEGNPTRTCTDTRRRETSHYTSPTAGIVRPPGPEVLEPGDSSVTRPAGPFRQAEFSSPCCNEAPGASAGLRAFDAWVHELLECVGHVGTACLAAHSLPQLSMTPSEPLVASDTDPNPESGSTPTAGSSHQQDLRRLTTRLFSQDELPSLLETIFSNRESTSMVHSLQRGDAQVVVDILDEVCHHTPINRKW